MLVSFAFCKVTANDSSPGHDAGNDARSISAQDIDEFILLQMHKRGQRMFLQVGGDYTHIRCSRRIPVVEFAARPVTKYVGAASNS